MLGTPGQKAQIRDDGGEEQGGQRLRDVDKSLEGGGVCEYDG